MNTEAIEKGDSITLLNLYMSIITNMVEKGTWESAYQAIGWMHTMKMGVFWDIHVEVDAGVPTNYLAQLGQGGLNLPDRSLYLGSDEGSQRVRALYKQHIINMLKMLNFNNPEDRADQIIRLETTLATIALPNSDLRDPFKTYNKMQVSQIQDLSANINWQAYLAGSRLNETTNTFNLIAPSYFKNLSSLVPTFTLEQVANYMRWDFIHEVANFLPNRFVVETFNFYGKVLLGEDAMPPRSTICIESTDESIGFLLSQYFVQRVFSAESKQMALTMLHNIEEVFQNTLMSVSWMDETTRQRALVKLSQVADMIGYPDEWPTYNFTVTDTYMANKISAKSESFNKDRASLKQPVNRKSWGMTPETVNAVCIGSIIIVILLLFSTMNQP